MVENPPKQRHSSSSYVTGHVRRALAGEQQRQARRVSLKAAASAAAHALRARYGEGIAVYLFGSVLDAARFRLSSDIDLAVRGLPGDHYYEAWRLAEEAAADAGRLDLIRLEDAPAWLVTEAELRGERLT